ncbi:hypothetical protein B0H13DRAFT_1917651 [Mycena leptocephala]|nr:hypothetical protein B0H13DRAFT_1917651 [Mycena leptocephala]
MTTMGKTFENLPLRKLLPLEAPHPPANLPRAADSEDHLGPVHMHRCCLSHVKKGTDRSGGAKDVWTFFDPTVPQGAQKQECMFCRQQHATDPHSGSTKFSTSTSTGVLRKHLYEHHINAWFEGCDKLKIPIKAKEAAKYVDVYRISTNSSFSS